MTLTYDIHFQSSESYGGDHTRAENLGLKSVANKTDKKYLEAALRQGSCLGDHSTGSWF